MDAIKLLETLKFVKPNNAEFTPPTVKHLIFTIKAIKRLWENVSEIGFTYLCPRNLNQDPLENFFGCIRLQRGRNVNPNCFSFISSFKTLVINNFMSPHSPGANCEPDEHDGTISTLRQFLEVEDEDHHSMDTSEEDENEQPPQLPAECSYLGHQSQVYVAGYLAKKILKSTNCEHCRVQLITTNILPDHTLINYKTYPSSTLLNPDTVFIILYKKFAAIAHFYVATICTDQTSKISMKLSSKIDKWINNPFVCVEHNLFVIFKENFFPFYLNTWVKNVNKILKGIDSRNVDDKIKTAALKEAQKHGRYAKSLAAQKQLQ